MPRSQAFSLIRRSLWRALQRGSAQPRRDLPRVTRRSVLESGLGAAGYAACSAAAAGCIQAPDARVAIVGAGLAGLTCAYRLQQAGVDAHVFDAATRVGGRTYTARGRLEHGQIAELGGELIDSNHNTMQRLAAELEIQLDDLPASTEGLAETLLFGRERITERAIVDAFVPLAAHMQHELAAAEADEAYFDALDALGLDAWLDSLPDLDQTLRSLLNVAYIGEYGRELSEHSKHILQFAGKPWREQGQNGSSFTDNGLQATWDTARGQPGTSGLLTVFLGGEASVASRLGTPEQRAHDFLPALDRLFSAASEQYRAGSALRMYWPSAPFALGSYACYLPGQAAWSGTEAEAVGRLHFCGEHTSADFQGYMEGAAESGERAAAEVLAAISIKHATV